MNKLLERAAKAAHEANRVYCEGLRDMSQLRWEDAPAWQRDPLVAGIKDLYRERITGISRTPEDAHNRWMRYKRRDGWVYGPFKNVVKKIHPNLVPYSSLPEPERMKDTIFRAVGMGVLSEIAFERVQGKSTYEYPKVCPACQYDGSKPPSRYTTEYEPYVPEEGDEQGIAYEKRRAEGAAELVKNWGLFQEEPLWFRLGCCQECEVIPQDVEISRLNTIIAALEGIDDE